MESKDRFKSFWEAFEKAEKYRLTRQVGFFTHCCPTTPDRDAAQAVVDEVNEMPYKHGLVKDYMDIFVSETHREFTEKGEQLYSTLVRTRLAEAMERMWVGRGSFHVIEEEDWEREKGLIALPKKKRKRGQKSAPKRKKAKNK